MGVLNNGTAYLNARGLARMCGIDHTLILRLGDMWGTDKEQPRVRRIRAALAQQGIRLSQPYIETRKDGTTHHAYPEAVCMAVLEYYAFEAKQSDNDVAIRNYRLLARSSSRGLSTPRLGTTRAAASRLLGSNSTTALRRPMAAFPRRISACSRKWPTSSSN